MKKIIVLVFSLLAACNSEVDSPNEKTTVTNINGVAAMGLVLTGTVSAYDFSSCAKGALLGADTLANSNKFNFDISSPSNETPILLELSNFTYVEEASSVLVDAAYKILTAALILNSGKDQSATVSIWTHIAHARTEFFCNQDASQAKSYIQKSNDDFAKALTFDPITLFPEQITDREIVIINVPALKYGVANAAISYYTSNLDFLDGGDGKLHVSLNSMSFADVAYQDVVYDRFLNGFGEIGQLKLGPVLIDSDTYRSELASLMNYATIAKNVQPIDRRNEIQIVADTYNDSTHMDIFPESSVPPLEAVNSVEMLEAKYTSCNYCWTNKDNDRLIPCAMQVVFDFDDYVSTPVEVKVAYKPSQGGAIPSGSVTPIETTALPNGEKQAKFGFDFPFDDPTSERTLVVTAKNTFGIENSFEMGIGSNSNGGGAGDGWITTSTWSPYPHSCRIKLP